MYDEMVDDIFDQQFKKPRKNLNQIKFNKTSFKVNEFKLKKSTLTQEGPLYEDIAVFKA